MALDLAVWCAHVAFRVVKLTRVHSHDARSLVLPWDLWLFNHVRLGQLLHLDFAAEVLLRMSVDVWVAESLLCDWTKHP